MSKVLQRRTFNADIKIRSNPDGTIGVRGYSAVFGQTAYGERIHPAAFNRTIAQADDVRLLVNHEGVPLARTKAGTLILGVDERGEWFDAPALDPANPDVQRLVSAMSRGDIDQCSFAGYFNDVQAVDGVQEVREVTQTDVSIVTYPWYDETTVGLTGDRDIDRALVCLRALSPDQRAKVEAAANDPAERTAALRALRAAPPGKSSYGDLACSILEAVESMIENATGVCPWLWLEDFGTDWAVYAVYSEGECDYFQVAYTADTAGVVTITGTPFKVEMICTYEPAAPEADPANDPTGDRGAPAPALTVAQARALLLDGLAA